jgi:MEMO1 family protein
MTSSKIRQPVVAGGFYPASAQSIKRQIESFLGAGVSRNDALACILPHAGYMYSGRVATETVSRINLPEKIVLLGPNHTGLGEPFSIMTEGVWQTPMGEVRIESGLAKDILRDSENLKEDNLAHASEHSLEVELPILQYFKKGFEIVPIAILSDDLENLKKTGLEIARAIKKNPSRVMLIASSDMTHYEQAKVVQEKDRLAIEAILQLNEDRLMENIRKFHISMCGYAPVITMLSAAKALGAKNAELVKYQTSGDSSGDYKSVVGYAGIIIN